MSRRLVALACALASAGAFAEGWSSRAEWRVYASEDRLDWGSAFNPGNRLLHQPEHVASSELRPDLSWSDSTLTLSVKPRWRFEAAGDSGEGRGWLNEATARWRAAPALTLNAGREVLLWGPAQFWNPSNPFYLANGKSNAQSELSGKGIVRARWTFDETTSVAWISQVDNGASDLGAERLDALKADWVGEQASAAAIVAALPGKSLQWRGWAQWTVDDATLLYGETAWARRQALVARRAATPTGWQIVSGDTAYALDALIGAAYTFENGWTVNVEAYRHGSGLATQEMAQWAALAGDAAAQLTAGAAGAPGALYARQLGAALDPAISPLGRRQVGVQLRNGSAQRIGWNLRYSRNLDDGSGQWVAQLSADLGERWQLWADVVVERGGARCEYGRWLSNSAMFGVTFFMW